MSRIEEQSTPSGTRLLVAHSGVVGVGLLMFVVGDTDRWRLASLILVVLWTAAVMIVGPVVNRSPDRVTWWSLLLVAVLFAAGPVLRAVVRDKDGLMVALPDVLLIPGYLLGLWTLVRVMRLRGVRDRDAVLDVAVVIMGALLLSLSFVVAPALETSHVPLWGTVMLSVYPVLDLLLLALMVMLLFTARARNPTMLLLGGAVGMLLVGDLGYTYLTWDGVLVPPLSYDLPNLGAFGLLGAAALHPSMRRLTTGPGRRVQAWSGERLAVLVPALLVPAVLIIPDANLPLPVRWLQAAGAASLVVTVLVRAGRAVREQSESRRVFEHMANHDALTGLASRSALNEILTEMLHCGHDVHVLFLDLDGFKLVNDSWGHAVGDELLVAVADRMLRTLPPEVLLCRAGGDEFLIVAPALPQDPDGSRFATKVVSDLSDPFPLSVGDVVVTPSIGIASSGGRPATADTLVRDADTAMYRAKDAGRRRAVAYHPTMGELVRSRVEVDRDLRKALERDELRVAYQPIVEIATGRVVGFEALARWQREGQDCPPDVFIPVAEETGLIVPIGQFVLGQALDELARWRAAAPWSVTVNVNVSARQLQDPSFAQQVLLAVSRRQLPTNALRLEVTESTLVEESLVGRQVLAELDAAGVSMSVDDFGTGYSSLSYLSRLRVHEVKIDRSFVAGITTRAQDLAIVRATVAMAKALGLAVVAEGIETVHQRDSLAVLGVEHGQGWFLGVPMPPGEALTMVRQDYMGDRRRQPRSPESIGEPYGPED